MKKLLFTLLLIFMASTAVMAQCEVIDMVINEARQAANKGDKAHAVKLLQNAINNKSLRDLNCSNFSRLAEEKRRIESQQQSSGSSSTKPSTSSQPSQSTLSVSSETITVNGERALKFTIGDVTFTMVAVQGGSFKMGGKEDNAKPKHRVTLSDYYIGQTEVTQALWRAIMGNNPSHFTGSNLPVEKVSWNDCQRFITKLNQLTGRHVRLPTEAEWEYAAYGGSKSSGYKYSGSNDIGSVAWYKDNSASKTHPVGQKQANELGIYDMAGNVWEWCQDWYAGDYYGKSPSTNPCNNTSETFRVCRGGGWFNETKLCGVSFRNCFDPIHHIYSYLGFRLALSD